MMTYSVAPRRLIIGLLLTLDLIVFAGCQHIAQPRPISAQQALIGKSESAVLACADAPQSASTRERARILTYYREAGSLETSFPGTKGSRPEGIRHGCTAILTLEEGRVTDVWYQMTPESADTHEHCEEIFQRSGP
jgi:hypothetical protein